MKRIATCCFALFILPVIQGNDLIVRETLEPSKDYWQGNASLPELPYRPIINRPPQYKGRLTQHLVEFPWVPFKYGRKYQDTKPKPIWNWIVRSTMQRYGHESRGQPLRPRGRGVLRQEELSPLYQKLSRECVDANHKAYSYGSYLCSGLIDFGITAFIELQILTEVLLCIAANYITGDNLVCLVWLLTRFVYPGSMPWLELEDQRFFSHLRRGLD